MAGIKTIDRYKNMAGVSSGAVETIGSFKDIVKEGYLKNEDHHLDIQRMGAAYKAVRSQFAYTKSQKTMDYEPPMMDSKLLNVKSINGPYPKPRVGTNEHLVVN